MTPDHAANSTKKWVTRRTIRVNRAATAWLIRRFVDADAEILFVDPADVAAVQTSDGALGFDAPGATFPHEDAKGRCSFEQIATKYCFSDHALREMGRIIGAADLPVRATERAEAAGVRAICTGFPLVAGDDHETVARSAFLFDALYASVTSRMRSEPE
jgi:hypothetical protein